MSADPLQRLRTAFQNAIVAAFGDDWRDTDPVIRPAAKPEHGDFQCNVAMGLGKRLGIPPRDVARKIIEAIELDGIADPPQIAGPGFINIRLDEALLSSAIEEMDTSRLGVQPDPDPSIVVIDMCGVNVAKQMHVGHLRSTIIGDAFARILSRLGHDVRKENHLGDWGLPIAMVLHLLRSRHQDPATCTLEHLDAAYRSAQSLAKGDAAGLHAGGLRHVGPHRIAELEAQNTGADAFRAAAGETLVGLQAGDQELVTDWSCLIDVTLSAMAEALQLLGVELGPDDNRGESSYRDKLEDVIDAFTQGGLCREDDGALVVDFEDRDRPLLIRKSDGGFLYATTDLAAVRSRCRDTGAARCIYVVDARQRDHFRDVFDAARLVGWDQRPDGRAADFVHTGFGSVLGPDKKPLKTRSGDNVTLASLLKEAIDRGTREVRRRAEDPKSPTHELSDEQLNDIGRSVGIGAVKYADLANDLVRDYVFDLDRMVAFEGDTGPYLQYAHARIRSIIRRAEDDGRDAALQLEAPEERRLALVLTRWNDTVHAAARFLEPHRIAGYLRDLAEAFNGFYQACPVLKAQSDAARKSRLRLADITSRVLKDGLCMLGIDAPDCM
ncbi:MAG: arginine--tRNA ligase [Phycisphaerales bacterium]|jgi:arginyl-tRNA synthetase|nr:arginine--tRNA ligase [Phycisphaerales bacterium]